MYIQPSISPASASLFFVEKKGGGLHPCNNYHGLYQITVNYPYTIPLVPQPLNSSNQQECSLSWICTVPTILCASAKAMSGRWLLPPPLATLSSAACFMASLALSQCSMISDMLREMLGKFVIVYIDDRLIPLKVMSLTSRKFCLFSGNTSST